MYLCSDIINSFILIHRGNTYKFCLVIMISVKSGFIDKQTLIVEDLEGEQFKITFLRTLSDETLDAVAAYVAKSFAKNFCQDKSEMVYRVYCDVQANLGLSFSSWSSNRNEERCRIGSRLKEIRERKGMEAKSIARLAGIDPSNLSKIESGRYSVGLDILSKIASTIGASVDIVEN